ncbi:MAG: methylenetetrahydrofolate reductase C-terminal domain-containing protein [Elusimicrobiota bacterium]
MLITQIKKVDDLLNTPEKRVVLITCLGCYEAFFPLKEVEELKKILTTKKDVVADVVTDYLCNPDYCEPNLAKHTKQIADAEAVIIFSCGVGVQTFSVCKGADKVVYTGCDTLYVPGFQGITAMEHDCDQCGDCMLNKTFSICPITACSKGLLNGQCGGTKNGKCEVDKDMPCGWELIYRRAEKMGKSKELKNIVNIRDYSKMIVEPEKKG